MSARPWQDRVADILDAVAEIQRFVAGMKFEDFRADAKTLKAVVADLAIIGEAASHVPDEVAAAHSEVPWRLMRAMRNRLMHVYFDVAPKIVWDTIEQDLPQLIEPLSRLLKKPDD